VRTKISMEGHTWETRDLDTVELVPDSYLDFLKAIKNVQLGQVQFGVTVDHGRVPHDDQIEPSTSPPPSSSCTPFSTDFLQSVSNLGSVLGRERSTSDSGSVGFDDTYNSLEGERSDTETGHDSSDSGRGRGHVGVGSVVEIKHEGVGSLDKDPLSRLKGFMDIGRSIDNVGSESLSECLSSA
jgi:hypothetical protein